MRGLMMRRAADVDVANRRSYWAYLFGRLKPGVSLTQAKTTLDARYRAIVNDVEAPLQTGASETYMTKFKDRHLNLSPGARGQSSIRGEATAPIAVLFAVTAVVLLIACANVANLLLARSAARATEMAVRLSIGADRRHSIGQLLFESCLLRPDGRPRGPARRRMDARASSPRCCRLKPAPSSPFTSTATCWRSPRWRLDRHGRALRTVPRAAQHAPESRRSR